MQRAFERIEACAAEALARDCWIYPAGSAGVLAVLALAMGKGEFSLGDSLVDLGI